jgi:hypothetical protein
MADSQQMQGRRSGVSSQTQHAGQAPHVERDHSSHGQSIASWTAVGVVMAGALIMAIAVVIAATWLFVVGAVVAVLGGISGKVLSAMGFGVSGHPGH